MTVQFDEEKEKEKLEELRRREEEEFAQAVAEKQGLPYANLAQTQANIDALRLIPEEEARRGELAAFSLSGARVGVALRTPSAAGIEGTLRALERKGYKPELFIVSPTSLGRLWSFYKEAARAAERAGGGLDISNDEIAALLGKAHSLPEFAGLIKDILADKKAYQISRLIEAIVAGALATKASDIHIEPEEGYARLRYRLDGVLHEALQFDKATYNLALSRVKLISGLKLNVKTEAQDGRFSVKLADTEIEIRTSMLPGGYGESIVLRVLNPHSISVPLSELGIPPKLLSIITREIEKPNGMILTTGPTGSGKTTTLYAFLKKVHTPEIKIITIEDPIEYHLPGVTQTQTNDEKGYTFLEGLRSALRQDPDVIMVGEIRDEETAQIAVNAALTGHLVFSTLHTNTAAGTFPRLIDLRVNPKIITSALNLAMAQRLVRKLCPVCKKETALAGKEKTLVERIIAGMPKEEAAALGNREKVWQEAGCAECNSTGFKGRIGVYEAIRTDEKIENLMRENPSEREIREAAKPQGILDMRQDGIIKVLAGITSLAELGRVVDLESA